MCAALNLQKDRDDTVAMEKSCYRQRRAASLRSVKSSEVSARVRVCARVRVRMRAGMRMCEGELGIGCRVVVRVLHYLVFVLGVGLPIQEQLHYVGLSVQGSPNERCATALSKGKCTQAKG